MDAEQYAKGLAWRAYIRLRKLGDYTPPWRHALRPHFLKRRKEQIEEHEKMYPDFRDKYDRLEKEGSI